MLAVSFNKLDIVLAPQGISSLATDAASAQDHDIPHFELFLTGILVELFQA